MLEQGLAVPAHIPESLVCDFDHVLAPVQSLEPQKTWANRLREKNGDMFFTPRNGGIWIVQGAELAVQMLRDNELFSADPKHNEARRFTPKLLPLQADPPDQGEYRKVLGSFFAPGNVRKMEDNIRVTVNALIDEIEPRGGCEFVTEFGEKFPIFVFLKLVGASLDDREELLSYAAMFTRTADVKIRTQGTQGLARYLTKLYAERRNNLGEDVLSRFLLSDFNGRPLNEEELNGLGTLLFLGGLDTVKSVLSFVTLYLGRHPEQYARIVQDKSLIPAAVEELIRISGTSLPERAVTRDVDYEGVSLKKGDRVLFFLPFMSFDPHLNDDPNRVDFHREISQHVVFGTGVHRCAGSHLARLEIRVFLEEWTRRFPTFRLDPAKPAKMGQGSVWTPEEVPILWP
ncbi:MAG: cytochrome [Sphingomonas bacterium]|uniref:cytochrome P450 n=1 Tax=Sphingomonas bacterium TaxID=1895847 RepID=UPI00261E654C|nr:cytochrome P450 [Sphingomonas bacterium]MDB5703850.1 cytochrome [Sphingomonas bacterium]